MKLIACWDRELQDNPPPLPVHVYKLFFLCRRDARPGAGGADGAGPRVAGASSAEDSPSLMPAARKFPWLVAH